MSNTYVELPGFGSPRWKGVVLSAPNLPTLSNTRGDVRQTLDTMVLYTWNGVASWIAIASPAAAIALDGLIGDVGATGPGVATATINPNVVDNTKLAQMAASTIKGNNTGAPADAIDLTGSQAADILAPSFVLKIGDTMSGQLILPSIVIGLATNDGIISAVADGGLAQGDCDGLGSTIQALTSGSSAQGAAYNASSITANGVAASVHAYADTGGIVSALGDGSATFGFVGGAGQINNDADAGFVIGYSNDNAHINAQGISSVAIGSADGVSSLIESTSSGSVAIGTVLSGGTISSTSGGSIVFGRAVSDAIVEAINTSSVAIGFAQSEALIRSSGTGSFAQGAGTGAGSIIRATQLGAQAAGYVADAGVLSSSGTASNARGVARNGGLIEASTDGANAQGVSDVGAKMISSGGVGSFCSGVDTIDSIVATGRGSTLMGSGLTDGGFNYSQMFGFGMDADESGFFTGFGSVQLKVSAANGVEIKTNKLGLSATIAGKAVLSGGTVTVSHPNIQAADIIMLTRQVVGGVTGDLRVGTIIADTSFVINSASGVDTSNIGWIVIKQ